MFTKNLPDPAGDKSLSPSHYAPLQAVGMSKIEVPLLIRDQSGELCRVPALAEAYVNLVDSKSRGIHMSRLYNLVQEGLAQSELSLELLTRTVQEFLKSHEGLSDWAQLELSFSAPVRRNSLKSQNSGWRTYPVRLRAEKDRVSMEVMVTYSSTCPASAALARQLIQKNFDDTFSAEMVTKEQIMSWLGSANGINATPHAQRSYAKVEIEFSGIKALESGFDYYDLIDLVEESLGTPVQTAVKREDEQEFALLNGQNLMFCEDAARKVQSSLEKLPFVSGFRGEFRHVESLHPHDAVAWIYKK